MFVGMFNVLFLATSIIVIIVLFKKGELSSEENRMDYIKNHSSDETPYGIWKVEVFKDEKCYKRYCIAICCLDILPLLILLLINLSGLIHDFK